MFHHTHLIYIINHDLWLYLLSLVDKITWIMDLVPKLSNKSQSKKADILLEKSDYLHIKYANSTPSNIQTLTMLSEDLQKLLKSAKSVADNIFKNCCFVWKNILNTWKFLIIFTSTLISVIHVSQNSRDIHKYYTTSLYIVYRNLKSEEHILGIVLRNNIFILCLV